jgi:octaprenyl-diphosphate synthase
LSGLKEKIIAAVRHDLAAIEAALARNLDAHYDIVRETAGHILFSGGKRLRPLLMVLSARISGYEGNDDTSFSTIFEYLHAATLLHDDLVDDAALRRGKTSAHAVYGNPTAVLTGDFLLARSLSIVAETGRPDVIKVIAGITEDMSQGEIQQLRRKGDPDVTEEEYRDVIFRKTASLIRGACRTGAMIADAPPDQEAALTDYGFHIGMAFQMADDILDYTSASGTLGKETGKDLKEGKVTLPLIAALSAAVPEDRAEMTEMIRTQRLSDQDILRLNQLVREYGGIAYAETAAARHVADAAAALAVFPPTPIRETLTDISEYALKRRA